MHILQGRGFSRHGTAPEAIEESEVGFVSSWRSSGALFGLNLRGAWNGRSAIECPSSFSFVAQSDQVAIRTNSQNLCPPAHKPGRIQGSAAYSSRTGGRTSNTPRCQDSRGSLRDGGHSETRPRAKLKNSVPVVSRSNAAECFTLLLSFQSSQRFGFRAAALPQLA